MNLSKFLNFLNLFGRQSAARSFRGRFDGFGSSPPADSSCLRLRKQLRQNDKKHYRGEKR